MEMLSFFSNLLSTKGTFVLTLPDMSPKKKKKKNPVFIIK